MHQHIVFDEGKNYHWVQSDHLKNVTEVTLLQYIYWEQKNYWIVQSMWIVQSVWLIPKKVSVLSVHPECPPHCGVFFLFFKATFFLFWWKKDSKFMCFIISKYQRNKANFTSFFKHDPIKPTLMETKTHTLIQFSHFKTPIQLKFPLPIFVL